jgi:hypothetical protein
MDLVVVELPPLGDDGVVLTEAFDQLYLLDAEMASHLHATVRAWLSNGSR